MSISPGVLTAVRWNEISPWLILVCAARVALLIRVIVLAALGVIITQWGWSAIERVVLAEADNVSLARLTEHPAPNLWSPKTPLRSNLFDSVDKHPYSGPLVRGWAWAMQPMTWLTDVRGWRPIVALMLAGVWVIAVWALVGGAIGRIAVLHLTRGESIGPIAALRAAAASWISTFASPFFCVCVIGVFALLLMFLGLVMRLSFLAFVAGLFWPLALLVGVAIAVFAIGLAFGWPFMWSTIAAERTDAFDGVSRGYAYTYQRPLHLVFFVLVATALGLLAQQAVNLIVGSSVVATNWAVERGLGDGDYADVALGSDPPSEGGARSAIAAAGGKLVRFWTAALASLAAAFPMAYLWSAAMAIYLLMRRLIDSTEMDEVALDAGALEPTLPPLVADAVTGVPSVPTVTPAPAETATVTEMRGGST